MRRRSATAVSRCVGLCYRWTRGRNFTLNWLVTTKRSRKSLVSIATQRAITERMQSLKFHTAHPVRLPTFSKVNSKIFVRATGLLRSQNGTYGSVRKQDFLDRHHRSPRNCGERFTIRTTARAFKRALMDNARPQIASMRTSGHGMR